MTFRWCAAVAVAATLSLTGCRLILGKLDDCTTDADCASAGAGLSCVDHLCVRGDAGAALDPRCTRLGLRSEKTLTLGAIFPKTRADGGDDPRGRLREQAAQLAVDQLNPPVRQGLRGYTIELLSCDSSGAGTAAADLAANLSAQGAVAIISSGSAETLAATGNTIPANVLLMSSSATTPELTDLPDLPVDGGSVGLVWRTAASDAFQGSVIAGEIGLQPLVHVAVIELDDPYGQGLYGAFRARYTPSLQQAFLYERSGDVTGAVDQAVAFAANAPSSIVIIAFPDDAVRIVNALTGRTNAPFFFTDSAKSPALFSGLTQPGRLENAEGTAPATAPSSSEAYVWFNQQYQSRFGADPNTTSFVANTFDAAMLLCLAANQALKSAPPTGEALAEVLTHVSNADAGVTPLDPPHFNQAASGLDTGKEINVEGASGPLDYDPLTGDAPGAIEVWQIIDGGFSTVKVVLP